MPCGRASGVLEPLRSVSQRAAANPYESRCADTQFTDSIDTCSPIWLSAATSNKPRAGWPPRSGELRESVGVLGGEPLEAPCGAPKDGGHAVCDPVGVAFCQEGECLCVHLRDVLWNADAHDRLRLLLAACQAIHTIKRKFAREGLDSRSERGQVAKGGLIGAESRVHFTFTAQIPARAIVRPWRLN
jgi:hypothetical protein